MIKPDFYNKIVCLLESSEQLELLLAITNIFHNL